MQATPRFDEPEIEFRELAREEAAALALIELWAADLEAPAANDCDDETPTSEYVVRSRIRPRLAPTRLFDDPLLDAWLRAG